MTKKRLGSSKRVRRWAVLQFPGSNCEHDAVKAVSQFSEIEVVLHWHEKKIETDAYEVVIIPGGFSYGDYLRAGAIAKISPAMRSLPAAIENGTHVMGICNGFQILLESKLLPGFLQVNKHLRFISQNVDLEVAGEAFPWFSKKDKSKKVRYPIAHKFGNYQPTRIDKLEATSALRYLDNPNGSHEDTAGIYRKLGKGSVFGLMPHPERASFDELGLVDGKSVWKRAVENLK